MHGIYELKERLCKELEEYGDKDSITSSSLDTIDKLAHTVKNLDKIIESYDESEEGYSGMYYPRMSYDERRSYARGRSARRDSMGRYSRAGDIADRLRDLMRDAPDENTKQEIQRLVTKMEQM